MKNKMMIAAIAFLTIIVNSCGNAQQSKVELKKVIENGAMLVDVRTPQEFVEGSVKGAVNIPLNTIESNLDKFDKNKDVVLFCRSGNRSAQAETILKKNGLSKIYNGGSWQDVDKLTKK